VIAESFKSSLRAIYHPRIEYPAAVATGAAASPVQSADGATVVPADYVDGENQSADLTTDSGDEGSGAVAPGAART
jgi:hypothetical protein